MHGWGGFWEDALGSVKCAWLYLEVCTEPKCARKILGVCPGPRDTHKVREVCARGWGSGMPASVSVHEGSANVQAEGKGRICFMRVPQGAGRARPTLAATCAGARRRWCPRSARLTPAFASPTVRPREPWCRGPRCSSGTWCCAGAAAGPHCCCTARSTRSGASCR